MRAILITVLATAVSAGCERAPLTDLSRDAQEVVEGARMKAEELRQLSAEELQELWAIECDVRATVCRNPKIVAAYLYPPLDDVTTLDGATQELWRGLIHVLRFESPLFSETDLRTITRAAGHLRNRAQVPQRLSARATCQSA